MLGLQSPVTPEQEKEWAEIFGGNRSAPGMKPYANRYGGHQFGNWAGQLGDGRAIVLGELEGSDRRSYEIQLKGAGSTPYSRNADGRAVLRSSVREFLCSEAMAHLNIPSTRALSLVQTGEDVVRDLFYDGRPAPEPGAIVTRVAPSFLRFGNFEILAANQELELLQKLVDYTRTTFYPKALTIAEWFTEVCKRTAHLMAEWTRVGFVHGVMNTDNLSILGLTIDYGPYGWLDEFDPDFTPNTTDSARKRYRFSNQPVIAQWNLERLAECLLPLGVSEQKLTQGLTAYHQQFREDYLAMMAKKLGFTALGPDDMPLLDELQKLFGETPLDHSLFYRGLANPSAEIPRMIHQAFYVPADQHSADTQAAVQNWIQNYCGRRAKESRALTEIAHSMNQTNPAFILRNYLTHQAAGQLAQGDATLVRQLMAALQTPYDAEKISPALLDRRPDWARDEPGCSKLSCSS